MTFIWKTFDLVFCLFHINTRFNVFYLLRQIIRRENYLFFLEFNKIFYKQETNQLISILIVYI